MHRWIDNELVDEALESGNYSHLAASGVPFAVSKDRRFCIVLRDHASRGVKGGHRLSGNYPPEPGSESRSTLNFYGSPTHDKWGFWFKIHVPSSVTLVSLEDSDLNGFIARTDSSSMFVSYNHIRELNWNEEDILNRFDLIWDAEQ